MPIYEYYCAECDTEFELVRPASKMDDPAPCKSCGQAGQRQLTQFGFKSNTYSAPRFKDLMKRPLRARDREGPGTPSDKPNS